MLREAQFLDLLPDREGRPFRRTFRRTWWLFLFSIVAGSIGGWMVGGSVVSYEARSTVTAVKTPLLVEETDLALSLFSTDSVLAPVNDELDLAITPRALLSGGSLDAKTIEGGALEITGRADNRETAIALSNAAARSFEETLEEKRLGDFEAFLAQDAFKREPRALAALAGGVAGALLAEAILFAFLLVRQPLLSAGEALTELLPDTLFLARVDSSSSLRLRRRSGRHGKTFTSRIFPQGILAVLADEIEASEDPLHRAHACFVVIGRGRRRDRRIQALLADMKIDHHWSSAAEQADSVYRYWIEATDSRLSEACEKSEVLVFVVLEWAARRHLQWAAEELALARGGKRTILLMLFSARLGQSSMLTRDSTPEREEASLVLRAPLRPRESSQRSARST